MTCQHIVSVSGGKDSTATYLLALERGRPFRAVFADTGNEHPATYDYVGTLAARTGGPEVEWVKADFTADIERKRTYVAAHWRNDLMAGSAGQWVELPWISAWRENEPEFMAWFMPPEPPAPPDDCWNEHNNGFYRWVPGRRPLSVEAAEERVALALSVLKPTGNPFLDLCVLKGRFPSAKARFCTDELKVLPINREVVHPLLLTGQNVISWQGVRAEESRARAALTRWQRLNTAVGPGRLYAYRPIHHWSVEEVFDRHRQHGINPNALYAQGMGRVGCMPCINCRKGELREIAARFPDHVARIREWERVVSSASKRGVSTFFAATNDPLVRAEDPATWVTHGIDKMVAWSQTGRGVRQYDLLDHIGFLETCSSAGVCE